MPKRSRNPDHITLEDVDRMTAKEFRLYMYTKMSHLDSKVSKLDYKVWAILIGVAITALAAALG